MASEGFQAVPYDLALDYSHLNADQVLKVGGSREGACVGTSRKVAGCHTVGGSSALSPSASR